MLSVQNVFTPPFRLQGVPDEVADQQAVGSQTGPLGGVRGGPFGQFPVHLVETEQSAHHAHQGAAGDEARGDQRAAVGASLVQGGILRAAGDEPRDQTAHDQRCVQVHGDEHTQRESQRRNADSGQNQCQRRTDEVEPPGGLSARHERFDDGRHGVGLRGDERFGVGLGVETVGLVQDNQHAGHGGGRDDRAEEFPGLLLARGGAQPVADLQVGDEAAGHREGRADHAADDQGGGHAARTRQPYAHQNERREDERHQGHARHGVGAHDGDGVGRYGGEEEGDQKDDQDSHHGLHPVVQHAELEEDEGSQQGGDQHREDQLHRQVALVRSAVPPPLPASCRPAP